VLNIGSIILDQEERLNNWSQEKIENMGNVEFYNDSKPLEVDLKNRFTKEYSNLYFKANSNKNSSFLVIKQGT
jgi:hypothetical protein